MSRPPRQAGQRSEILEVLGRYKQVFWTVGGFSGVINLLYLAPSLYMMQVYDRVLNSRNETTLIMLSLITLGAFAVMAWIEQIRSQVLVRVGNQVDDELSARVFTAAFERNLRGRTGAAGAAMNDLTQVRQFVTGNGLFAFFDMPWTPIYILVVYLFHPVLGIFVLFGAVVSFLLAWLNERSTKQGLAEANQAAMMGSAFATTNLRNAEVIEAMGMLPALRARWKAMQDRLLQKQSEASDRAGLVSAAIKFWRLTMQSAVLGIGALLVLENLASPGVMIAASILAGRALAPVDLAIASWKQFSSARTSYQRLSQLLEDFPARTQGMSLPRPKGLLTVEQVIASPPGAQAPVLRGVQFAVKPGEVLVIVGPSASGKSTLARLMVGVWLAQAGKVRLDGADIFLWNKDELGPWIGYLPQDIELFEGTIAENIARFGEIDSELVIEAASRAGMHDMILRFPKGYDTPIGESGSALSGGQRQRIALARALYGDPALIVLDEPNSNLDDAGEQALVRAVMQAKSEGRTVILITHRTSIVGIADNLMVLREGAVHMHGPRQQVLQALQEAAQKQQVQAQQATAMTVVNPSASAQGGQRG
ncbi:MAG: type I secretion system permease/ATPase [Betaproteobacteria bacterium]|nr:type I secretion system permease/ATPase [Betaproteobacteria bacterium]NBP39370.1 type I secretion system permease/ATPase [Betaproteobacteria bacterium]NBS40153.1 type I secretion system permease/ATPase [Betaproteobacteria bacterium]NBT05823.1 type I secretion system permease/ATPase [Betaproteobacteria bacterium]NCY08156.1 type I secretion system permease/ATPase [Betaproteobacteria bacterium]